MEGLEEAGVAGMSSAYLPGSCDIDVITQEDHQWEQWRISNVTVFLDQRKCNRWRSYLNGASCKGEKLVPFQQFQQFPSWTLNYGSLRLFVWCDRRRPAGSPLHPEVAMVAVSTALHSCAKYVLWSLPLTPRFLSYWSCQGADPAVTGKARGPEERIWNLGGNH